MPDLRLSTEIVEARRGIERQFGELLEKEFAGLAPGTTYLKDPEFYSWFETERNGIPLGPDPMGQPLWQKEPRPNFEQMLALAGPDGHEILRRYGKVTGRDMDLFIKVIEAQAKMGREQNGATVGR